MADVWAGNRDKRRAGDYLSHAKFPALIHHHIEATFDASSHGLLVKTFKGLLRWTFVWTDRD